MTDEQANTRGPEPNRWLLLLLVGVLGSGVPILGTLYLRQLFPAWSWSSLPFHSSLEVIGAAFGLVLAVIILFAHQRTMTSRRLWVASALIAMAVLDIVHSCVPVGVSFVWLHSIAVLAGGALLAFVWLPERKVSRARAWAVAAAVLLLATLVGMLSAWRPAALPAMVEGGRFTLAADALNFIGGGLTLLAAASFATLYYKRRGLEDLLFLLLCLLFGTAGVIFRLSDIWEAGWWFWHVLRFVGYLLALWLALFAYRTAEDRVLQTRIRHAIGIAQGDYSISIAPRDETDKLGAALQAMTQALKRNREQAQQQDWLKTGIGRLNDAIRGDPDITELSRKVIAEVSTFLKAQVGAFYVLDAECRAHTERERKETPPGATAPQSKSSGVLRLTGSYAFRTRKNLSSAFRVGEGLVGQAVFEKQRILMCNVPEDYTQVCSTLLEGLPRLVCVAPFLSEDRALGVIEIGTLGEITDVQLAYLDQVLPAIAVAVQAAQSRTRLAQALSDSQALAEELQAQQEALAVANRQLEERAERLQRSEAQLQVQQEELQQTNEELEEKTESLENQTEQVRQQNRELEKAGKALEQKAQDLAMASKYKSEFLANMSHVLRTPLNSLLVLAHHLAANTDGNLTQDQVESAQVISSSGESLLSLINEILDLSKIEAGKLVLQIRDVLLEDIAAATRTHFSHLAAKEGLAFDVRVDPSLPGTIRTDPERLQQIIRNLVGNAIKFTHRGHVTVSFARPPSRPDAGPDAPSRETTIAVSVSDSGIGIPADRLKAIFEAFQQVDGSTSRQYGGTGLGLSITRELAALLGGTVHVESGEGEGSTFTVFLPQQLSDSPGQHAAPSPPEPPSPGPSPSVAPDQEGSVPAPSIPDDRGEVAEASKVVLVIEDDPNFAKTLRMLAHRKQFAFLHAGDGKTGLNMAAEHAPDAIILDIRMPGMDGWAVLESLKEDVRTRHIPVHIMSVEEDPGDAVQRGAIGYLSKPVTPGDLEQAFLRIETAASKSLKELLIVEDNKELQLAISKLLGGSQVKTRTARTIQEAVQALGEDTVDCMILDLTLPDGSGLDLLEQISNDDGIPVPPVVVYTGRDVTLEEVERLREYTDSIIIKGPLAEERLVDETSLFLHQVVADMPQRKKAMILRLHDGDALLRGKKLLLADDDMRNLFALAKVLESKGIIVRKASDGAKALALLAKEPDISLVLMDVMMPHMDGYEAMRQIRDPESDVQNHDVPVIALTAKAMKEDRRKCIEAGANDYLAKPVNADKLLSLIRVWLAQ